MQEFLQRDIDYVMRVDEVMWGGLLLALTLMIHGIGLFLMMRASGTLMTRASGRRFLGMGVLIVVAWMIVTIHLVEVLVWAGFFVWKGAQPSGASAFYNALVNYTTLAAGYLPLRWRLLEGMLGMAGLLSFAWSTSALIAIAQQLLQQALTRAGGHGGTTGVVGK